MKKYILNITLFLTVFIGNSQEWQTDFETAKNIAHKKNQHIVLVFQGSDWCAPCIKLEREIWSSSEFKTYASANFVLLKADFPRKKKNSLDNEQQINNNKLMERYNNKGYFPFVVVLSKNGDVLGETGYKKMKPSAYINLLSSF